MQVDWYYIYNKEKIGPITLEQVYEIFFQGIVNQNTYFWRRGLGEWVKLKDIPEIYNFYNIINNNREKIKNWNESKYIENSNEENARNYLYLDQNEKFLYGPYNLKMLQILQQESRLESNSTIIVSGQEKTFQLNQIFNQDQSPQKVLEDSEQFFGLFLMGILFFEKQNFPYVSMNNEIITFSPFPYKLLENNVGIIIEKADDKIVFKNLFSSYIDRVDEYRARYTKQ